MNILRTNSLFRTIFERFILSRWDGHGIRVRYWDKEETYSGTHPYNTTIIFKKPSALRNLLLFQSLGFGNAYARGDIEIQGNIQQFLEDVFDQAESNNDMAIAEIGQIIVALHGRGSAQYAEKNAHFHYDIGNTFFSKWLDGSMTYSCGYFRTEQDDLSTAQRQKNELLCRKLELAPGQSLLDIGCGWGPLMFHAVERYGVNAVGVTPSREQADFIHKKAVERGLNGQISVAVTDWRKLSGQYDRVVSVGMYEHVGVTHGRKFFERWKKLLADDGVSVLHTIGAMNSRSSNPWIDQNIFPGGYLPSLTELVGHARESELMITDIENLWKHYALTLSAWIKNYELKRDEISEEMGDTFDRTWWLYLNSSRAAFDAGRLCLWQLILTKGKRTTQPLTRERLSLAHPAPYETNEAPPERDTGIRPPYV